MAEAENMLRLNVLNGVTTVRLMLGSPEILALRNRAASGELFPRIYTSSRTFYGSESGDSTARLVTAAKAAGYDFIKLHMDQPNGEAVAGWDSAVAAAKRVGIPIAGHPPFAYTTDPVAAQAIERAVAAGYRSIEHIDAFVASILPMTSLVADSRGMPEGLFENLESRVIDTTKLRRVAESMRRAGVSHTPTLALVRQITTPYDTQEGVEPARISFSHGHNAKRVDETTRMGVEASGGVASRAAVAGTRNVAEFLGTLDSTGIVEVGKRADLVLLRANPLEDVHHTAAPVGVMLGGRWLGQQELETRLAALQGTIGQLTWITNKIAALLTASVRSA